MLKGIFGAVDNGSEVSSSSRRKSKRRDGEEEEDAQTSRRSRAHSTGTSSTSKRKSSHWESTDQPSGFHPTSTAFSSTSRSPYADVAAPSVASSYATAYTEPSNASIQRPEVVRNESMADKLSRSERSSGSRRDSERDSQGDVSRSIDGNGERRNVGQSDTSRRDSRRKPSRKDTATRALEEHDNSLPQNQFPGQEPAGFGVASPYRPPGLASYYYGDHGESISDQPGVRPDRPAILISADQAHLLEPTVEAHPPPEPSSLGHVGAAADFFGGEVVAEPMTNVSPSRPGRKSNGRPGRRPSLKAPGKDSTAYGTSPRSSPGPDPRRRPMPQSQNSSGIGMMGAGAAPLAVGKMAAGVGAAADYYTGNIVITPHDIPLTSGIPGRPDEVLLGSGRPYAPASSAAASQSQSFYTTTEHVQTTNSKITSSSRPSRPSQTSSSNMPLYGAAAAAAGVAGAAYLAHEHTSAQHEQAFSQSPTDYQGRPSDMPFRPGQNQTQSFGPQQQQQLRRRRTGAFGKFVDWFQDPAAIAEYEAYTEATGVCKYCFEPGTTPAEAPRKHYYRKRRPSSGSRYGSSTRVDKLTRYSSDENLRRRSSKKGYSTTEKVLATGLAGVGATAVVDQVYKNRNDFNDTYSVKSGQPDNRSRVSFQENEVERYSTSKRSSRRDSDGLSRLDSDRRRQSSPEGEVRYEKRSSRRRDSSGSDNRTTSRGGNLSTPVALASAAAVGAALTSSGSRRRSRTRTKSPRKNQKGYYSKRVSPKHSYVDLNQTLEDSPSGPLGLGGFFSSPSSNSKRGKKNKGLFNFSNNSSSSSDADLVFGEGTVRRRNTRRRRDDRTVDRRQSGMGDAAAILGMAATGAALAAETSRRDDKGKKKEGRKADLSRYDDDRDRRSRRDDRRESANKIKLYGYQDSADNGDEGAWEDASDDDRSSVDMGLAYGGRLSSRASKESLNEGTNILGWRFGGNQKRKEEEKKVRRQSSRPDLSGYDSVQTGLVAGAAGLAGAAAVNYYSKPGPVAVESPPNEMPPLRYVDPVPVDSREQTPRRQSMQSSVSQTSYSPVVTRTSNASLEHPQPVTPISKDVYQGRQPYTDGPSGPVIFDKPPRDSRGQETGIVAAAGTAVAIGAAAIANNDAARERKRDHRRSASIPTVVPSLKEAVSFDLTKEQEDREQRRERKRREKEARRTAEAASAAQDATPEASIITGAEHSPERKLETWRLRDAVKAGGPGSMEPPVREPSPQSATKDFASMISQPLPTPERETRLSEIDRQLEELYAQHRAQEARKKKDIEAAGLAAAAVALGAGVIAATSDSPSKSEDKPRRKSSLRKSSKYRDQDAETESGVSARSAPSASASDTGTESAAERLARKAARQVQNQRAPSPVHQHDDYTSFFVPPELKDHMAEHNREAEVNDAKIVDIVPGMRRADTFPDELYHAYGTEDSDIPPTKLPWKVPMLGLVSPTPPPRSPSITAERSPVILATSGSKDIGEPETEDYYPRDIEPRRSNSKVTWGDHEINVYEVITPEYERDGHDFTTSSPEISAKKELPSSPLRQAFTAEDVDTSRDKDMGQPVPPVEKMTTEQREHVALGRDLADLPPARDISRDVPEQPLTEEKKTLSAKSTPAMQFEQFNPAGSMTSNGSFYQSPFASTVSDLDLPIASSSSRVSADEMDEIAEKPNEQISEERVSKSERRRRERAEAASEAPKDISQIEDVAEPHVPGGFDDAASDVNVFDYMVTSNGSTLPSASALGAVATSVLASVVGKGKESEVSTSRGLPASSEPEFTKPTRAETFDESAFVDSFASPKRTDTFDEGALVDSFATPRRAETFAEGDFSAPKTRARVVTSDPEDWEKSQMSESAGKKKSRSKKDRDDNASYVSSNSSSKKEKKSKRDSQGFYDAEPDEDVKSAVSTTTDRESSRSKSKSKSSSSLRRGDEDRDDEDTRSVISDARSQGSESTSTGREKRRGKEKEKETPKKSGWALLGGLIGTGVGSKSQTDLSSEKSDSKKKKRRSSSGKTERRSSQTVGDDDDGNVPEKRRSRSASQSSSAPLPARSGEESVDDAFVSADETGMDTNGDARERDVDAEESFLATRPELPTTNTIPMASEIKTGSGKGVGSGASGLPLVAQGDSASEDRAPAFVPLPQPESSETGDLAAEEPEIRRSEQALSDVPTSTSTPRQRRLSNLRTTDLGSSPTINSPGRMGLGRFPVSPGVNRTGSVSSPPTSFPTNSTSASTSSSSPLSTPRTRQGRPSSTDFRSGKEFRPLYLVERHSAMKTESQIPEEETYPSLPSSRTSSAHPSIENLRGEYSDGDVDTSPGQQFLSREVGRRFSWSDSQDLMVRSSREEEGSGEVTPTQETFPVGARDVGGVAKKEKSKPKYEFHSPSELLEDPSRHQDGSRVDDSKLPDSTEDQGSPLPSALGTEMERSTSPIEDSASRSRSSTSAKDIALGVGPGAAGMVAVGMAAVGIPDWEKEKGHEEEFTLQPVEKKGKKDKGSKKRMTLATAQGEMATTPETQDVTKTRDLDLESAQKQSTAPAELEPSPAQGQEPGIKDESAAPSKKSRKSKKDKEDKKSTRKGSLALSSATENESTETDLEPTKQADPELVSSATEPITGRDLISSTPLDTTDSVAHLDEGADHISFPFDARATPPPVERHHASSATSSQRAPTDAFESAFEAARNARGLPDDINREIAMDSLTAATVTSGIQPVNVADIPKQANEKNPFGDDYEIGRSTSRDMPGAFGQEEDPLGEGLDVAPDEMVPVVQEEERSPSEDVAPEDIEAGAGIKTPIEAADEFAWAPTKKSKKDKKGNKKVREFDDFESESSALGLETTTGMHTPDPVAEEMRDLEQQVAATREAETPSEAVDELAWAPTQKSKKKKKGKKNSRAVEDFESVAVAVAEPMAETEPENSMLETANVMLAEAEPAAEEARDLVTPSSVTEAEEARSAPVAEAEKIVEAAQESAEGAIIADDDLAWAPPGKKSKKDKKGKKKSAVAFNDSEPDPRPEEPTEQMPVAGDQDQSLARDTQGDISPEETAPDAVPDEAAGQPNLSEEPVAEPAEDDWAVPVKKSKKDKKSKRKSTAIDDVEPDSQVLQPAALEGIAGEEEEMQVSDQPTKPEDIPAIEASNVAEERDLAEEPVEDEWAVPVKKSKRKSKRKSTMLDDAEPASQFPTLDAAAAEVAGDNEDIPRDMQESEIPAPQGMRGLEEQTAEKPKVLEEPVEDEWAVPVKKSKKDKKSKKKSIVFDDFESESPATDSQTPAEEESHDVQQAAPNIAEAEQNPAAEAPRAADEAVEDEWAAPIKKLKKDKKSKKKAAVFDGYESESPVTESQTPVNVSEESREAPEEAPVTETPEYLPLTDAPERAEEPIEHEWAAPTKKSKKDEKSKRKTLDFDAAEPAESSTPASETRDIDEDKIFELVVVEPEQIPLPEETKTVEGPVEDEWAIPTKKPKKDKNSKRKTLDSDSAEPTETSVPAYESRDIENDEPSYLASTAIAIAGLAAGALAGLAGAVIPNGDQEKPAEDEQWVPASSKKSKKDKKSKKKGMAFSLANDVEAPVTENVEPEPAEEQATKTEEPAVVDDVMQNTSFTGDLTAESAEELAQATDADKKAPVQEDEWAVPIKKSKDKKSKKNGSFALLEENLPAEESHQQEQTPEHETVDRPSRAVAAEDFPILPAAAHVDIVTGHYFGMLKNYQPAAGAPDNQAQTSKEVAQDVLASADEGRGVEDPNFDHPPALPHSTGSIDRDSQAITSSSPAHGFPVVVDLAHVDDVVGFHYGMLKDYKPDTTGTQQSKEIAEQVLPASSEIADAPVPVDAEESQWAVPAKRNKKEKKKKRQSPPDEEQPGAEKTLPSASVDDLGEDRTVISKPGELSTPHDVLDHQAVETEAAADYAGPSAANEEDLYPVISKKSKKDKKKKRQSVFKDEPAEVALPVAAQTEIVEDTPMADEPRELTEPNPVTAYQPVEADAAAATELAEPSATNDEDLYPVVSKKSTKDKRKKPTLDDFEEPSTEQSSNVLENDAALPIAAGVSVAALGAGILSSSRDGTADDATASEALPIEDDFISSSSKKSKDKKKQRSAFDGFNDEETAPPATEESRDNATDEVLPSVGTAHTEMPSENLEESAGNPAATEEEPFGFSTKKSNKDKEKMRQSNLDDFDDAQTAPMASTESGAITSDDVMPPADVADTAILSDRQADVLETPAETEEQPFEVSTKKTKKGKKKKRGSTFDDVDIAPTTSADDTGALAPVTETEPRPEEGRNIDEAIAPAQDDSSVVPSKKSKKDKKQRQSGFDDLDTEEQRAAPSEGRPLEDPSLGYTAAPDTEERGSPPSKVQEPVLGDDGWLVEQAASQNAPAEEGKWAVPTKKSKKDKEKKNTLSFWADGDDSTSQPTEASTPAKPAEAREVQTQEPVLRNAEMAGNFDAQAAVIPGTRSTIAAQPDDDEGQAMRHQRHQSKFIPGGWGEEEEEEEEEPNVDEPPIDEPIVDEPMADEAARFVEKPSKVIEERMQDVDFAENRDNSQVQQEVQPIPEEEEMSYVIKKSKKDKKGKKSKKSDVYSEEPESREVEQTQIEAAPTPPQQEQADNVDDKPIEEAAPEDVWIGAPKKNKKDKKGKKSKNVADEEVAAPEILAIPETVQEYSSRDVGGDANWAVPAKKSRKDKKKEPVLEDEVAVPDIIAIPDTSQGSSNPDPGEYNEWAAPMKKSKKDKKPKRQSTRDLVDVEQPGKSVAFPVNDLDHVDDVAGHYHGMLRDYRPADGAPDNRPLTTSRNAGNVPGIPHIDDVTGHYYGMLRDYQPAEGATDNKAAYVLRDTDYAERSERVPSPVSDEEARRARRARRKASPVYSGEEPEDLPGNRSLTPPADHDDMMSTALGVAAGLGLTGAAASAASARPSARDGQSRDLAQAAAPTIQAPAWSFAKMNAPGDVHQAQRDSGVQFADSPTLPHDQFNSDSRNRDSGYLKSPANRESWENSFGDNGMLDTSSRPPRPQSPTSSSEDVSDKHSKRVSRDMDQSFTRREPSPVLSTSKERSSQLFTSPPSNRIEGLGEIPKLDTAHLSEPTTDIHRSPSIHGHHRTREEFRTRSPSSSEPGHMAETHHEHSTDIHRAPSIHGHHRSREQLRARSPASSEPRHAAETHLEQSMGPEPHQSVFGPYSAQEGNERGFSPPKTPLHTISEHSQDTSPSLRRQRDMSDVGEGHPRKTVQRQESGRNLRAAAGIAGGAAIGALAAHELSRDDEPATHAKSLGKSKANTKSSRSLPRTTSFDPDVVPSFGTHDPSKARPKEAARDMSDVYDGHGEYPGSPMSPTRPPSMRKRQSMQQIRDLETRLDQLAAENRTLAEAKVMAEQHLADTQLERHRSGFDGQEAVETANLQLREKDEAIARLQQELEGIRQDHARLSEVNAGLSDAHENLRMEHEQRYSQLEDAHAETHENWQESSRELETLRGQHAELSGGMEDIIRHEIDTALAEKNVEIERLRTDLEMAKEKINELEQQIMSGGGDDILNFRDEDYFESACQSLCQHVQQWVLRFSKFSDTLVCRTTQQIRDEKLVDRFDLAILDGSDVDAYLGDRIKRRDVFMSVVMTMIFEYIFTRYLFGMDRDQRQTLKKLEKNLSEVGERGAVHQWRAMTLTLLAKREAFKASRENDTEAVVLQVYDTLAKFLPPPQNLQASVQESLRNVMRTAVDLSIEMRTQKAEYIMLPPLQPEYDTNGDLTRKVYFNASLMNERSGETTSNDELEAQQAVVRMVLFPLVVKKGNDAGEGEEEIVVCPAQVLVARPDRKSKANSGRVLSAQSDRMSVDQMSRANASRHSLAPSTMDMSNVI